MYVHVYYSDTKWAMSGWEGGSEPSCFPLRNNIDFLGIVEMAINNGSFFPRDVFARGNHL
jgi:hypothetical protein